MVKSIKVDIALTYLHQQVFHDVLTTFLEDNLITWWWPLDVSRDKDLNVQVIRLKPSDECRGDFKPRTVNVRTVCIGIKRILNPKFRIRDDLRQQVSSILFDPENCDFDVEGADCIIQAALFGEIVYG